MFGGRGLRKVARQDGPVAIPRGEKVQLRTSTSMGRAMITSTHTTTVNSLPPPLEPTLPSRKEAANSPAWHGQTLEYATGVVLRQHILEPILQDESIKSKDEMARFLSYYCRGKLLFLPTPSGTIHIASIERVTNKDEATIASWWKDDKVLSYTGGQDWSDWWTRRCNFIDPGCEMVKLVGEDDEILAVAYFERNIVDKHGDGDRITLIRGIRIDPKLNLEAIRRSSVDRLPPDSPIAYPDVAAALLCHIVFTSIRYGTQGVAVNCPKADSIEDFYQHFMGLPHHMDPLDGRRYFRLDDRLGLLRLAFREQIDFKIEYKDQVGMVTNIQQTADDQGEIAGGATDGKELQRASEEIDDHRAAQTLAKILMRDSDHGVVLVSAGTTINYEASQTSIRDISKGLDNTMQTIHDNATETPVENVHAGHSLKSSSKRSVHNGVANTSARKTKRVKVSDESEQLPNVGNRHETKKTQCDQQDEPGRESDVFDDA
jgi:hypothetical protein